MFGLRYLLFHVFIVDSFEEIYVFRKNSTVLIKDHHLIEPVRTYGKDLNLIQ
jgi:hypothetical protein